MTEAERVVRRANAIVERVAKGTRMGREIHADEVLDLIAAYVVMRGLVAELHPGSEGEVPTLPLSGSVHGLSVGID